MQDMDNRGGAFGKLFRYISGNNRRSQSITMIAPVFFNQLDKQTETMSFVMPDDFSLSVTPLPNDPAVQVERITDYTVAAIRFNGQLAGDRIEQHK